MTRAPGSINCLSPGRRAATYDYETVIPGHEAQALIHEAEEFVDRVEAYLEEG